LLAQEVTAKYHGRAQFISENYGESKLAEKFGIKRYPAVFVDDVLIATPRDFGFYGEGEKDGRYTPWKSEASHKKFQDDLHRMIDLILKGKKTEAVEQALTTQTGAQELAAIPSFTLTDLDGKPLSEKELEGRVVVVEFWATWCPPCLSTLEWLGSLHKKYGDRVAVVAVAVESQETDVRKLTSSLSRELHVAMATPEAARAFGDVVAVPTMFIFDRSGKTAQATFGAPPNAHEQAEKTLDSLLSAN
jgi:thiol-disulfide isomerase/thioredoxin